MTTDETGWIAKVMLGALWLAPLAILAGVLGREVGKDVAPVVRARIRTGGEVPPTFAAREYYDR